MDARPHKEPGPDHPITIEPEAGRVVVRAGDTIVAESMAALRMQEASYPPVHYVPRADVDDTLLAPSATTSYCPYKGEASYQSITTPEGEVTDAIWFYESPYPAVAQIVDHVAFYTDRVKLTIEAPNAAEVA